ncbi:MAG: hypothetical protein NTW55_01185 [Planctomycetota bacterium]|nr:hypothetical protein [Planctomycetota bacterium]
MKFVALLKKELRECLPWMLLAAVFLTVFGGIALREQTLSRNITNRYPAFSPGSEVKRFEITYDPDINIYSLTRHYPVSAAGSFLLIASIGLGLALGIRQFWMEQVTRTWSFLIHRSINRRAILWSKLAAAAIVFIISPGIIWSIFYWYSLRPELFAVPSTGRIFVEGWIFVVLGFMVYLGMTLAGLNRVRWYTTKLFGLLFAGLMVVVVLGQWSLLWAFIFIIVGITILLSQIIEIFLSREF